MFEKTKMKLITTYTLLLLGIIVTNDRRSNLRPPYQQNKCMIYFYAYTHIFKTTTKPIILQNDLSVNKADRRAGRRSKSSAKPVDKEVQLADDSVGFASKSPEHASCC